MAIGITEASGHDFRPRDVGDDVFDRMGEVLQWSDERLKAAADGVPLPDPPELYADLTALKIGYSTTLVYEVLLFAMTAILAKQAGWHELVRTFGLNRFRFDDLWVPGLAVIAMYVFTIGYTVFVVELGPEFLRPNPTVDAEVTRETILIVMTGVLAVLAAPLTEELFFRGLIFGGLLRWGVWPAAAISSLVFGAAHFDPGSMIPFTLIGLTMCWLYWRRGCLADSIAFHLLFNGTSFVILVLQR